MDKYDSLIQIIPDLKKQKEIAVDLESNSMYRYFPSICLMQISISEIVYLIDIPKLGLPIELKKILIDPQILKIFQDLQYDLALFKFEFNFLPYPIYDISIADKLIRRESTMNGLHKMLKRYLDKESRTNKSIQRSNWCQRPLNSNQIRYAVEDTELLIKLKAEMATLLDDGVKNLFLKQKMLKPHVVSLDKQYNVKSMWKNKGIEDFDQIQLNLLRKLLIERDKIAREINRPIHWIASESRLMRICKLYPLAYSRFYDTLTSGRATKIQKEALPTLYKNIQQKFPNKVIRKPELGTNLQRWIYPEIKSKFENLSTITIRKIRDWVKEVSESTQLIPEMIMNKQMILNHVQSKGDSPEFSLIPPQFKPLFQKDFSGFMKSLKSNLTYLDLAKHLKSE